MSTIRSTLRDRPDLRAAMIVPSVIALIFSIFNLSAAPDPALIAAQSPIAVVNDDAGLPFPPINMGARMIDGLTSRLPMPVQIFATEDEARAALEAETVVAVLRFPADFSRSIAGTDAVPLSLITSGSLTAGQGQMAGALPGMIESGVSSAILSIRLAMAQGRLPDMVPPVTLTAELVNPVANPAARMAPFVAGFVTALAAMVGAIIGYTGTRGLPGRIGGVLRTLFPMVALPLAAAVLTALVVGFAGGDALGLWLSVAGLSIALGWLFAGALALFGWAALIVIVPLVFYQAVLGGAQIPVAAAPEWLQFLVPLHMEAIGGHFRTLIIAGPHAFPWMLAAVAAVLGLAMIWLRALIIGGRRA